MARFERRQEPGGWWHVGSARIDSRTTIGIVTFLASSCAYALESLAVPQTVLPPPVLTGASWKLVSSRVIRGAFALETLARPLTVFPFPVFVKASESRDSWHLA